MEKAEITHIVRKKDRIIEYSATKKVTKSANSGHVILPKELIGKIITIKFIREDKK
jgi:putative transposon-encoded protein